MYPDDIKLTTVNTPWGLMPMGIKNTPAIHQKRVTSATLELDQEHLSHVP